MFQGRYKAIHVEKESSLLELSRYVVLNPVRAEMVRCAKDWPWSSYRAAVGQVEAPSWLNAEWLLAAFGKTKSKSIEGYKRFVSEGKNQPSPWQSLRNRVYLGSDVFIETMNGLINGDKDLSEIPSSQRRVTPKSIKEYELMTKNRNKAILRAYTSEGHTLKEIDDYFGLHYATVSRLVNNTKSKT